MTKKAVIITLQNNIAIANMIVKSTTDELAKEKVNSLIHGYEFAIKLLEAK